MNDPVVTVLREIPRLLHKHWPKGEAMKRANVGVVIPPSTAFEYDSNVVHIGPDDLLDRLDYYLNEKAKQGWKVHTCQRIEQGSYFVLLFKLVEE